MTVQERVAIADGIGHVPPKTLGKSLIHTNNPITGRNAGLITGTLH